MNRHHLFGLIPLPMCFSKAEVGDLDIDPFRTPAAPPPPVAEEIGCVAQAIIDDFDGGGWTFGTSVASVFVRGHLVKEKSKFRAIVFSESTHIVFSTENWCHTVPLNSAEKEAIHLAARSIVEAESNARERARAIEYQNLIAETFRSARQKNEPQIILRLPRRALCRAEGCCCAC